MQFTVTCDGTPVGFTDLPARAGLCAGYLAPLSAYEQLGVRAVARRLGVALLAQASHHVPPPVAARAFRSAEAAAETLMPRLGLLDTLGDTVPVVRLYAVELPRRSRQAGAYVITDLGEAGASRTAVQSTPVVSSPASARPAA
jgi:hypothetical protein